MLCKVTTMDQRSDRRRSRSRERHKRRKRVILLVVLLFLGVAGLLLYWNQTKDLGTTATAPAPEPAPTKGEEAESSPEGDSPQEEPTPSETTSASREEANEVMVRVAVENVAVGLSILEDEQLVYDQVASPGFSEEFRAETVTVSAADAGAVLLEVSGDEQGLYVLGPSGEQVTRTYTAENPRGSG
jgi:cytoskeletal protein RodZ